MAVTTPQVKTVRPTDLAKKVEPTTTEPEKKETVKEEVKVVETPAPEVKVETTTEETPVVEEKEQIVKPETKTATVVAPVKKEEVSTDVRIVREMIENYNLEATKKIPNEATCRHLYIGIIRYAISNQENHAVLNEVLSFMRGLGTRAMHPSQALIGLNDLGKKTADMIKVAYTLLYGVVNRHEAPYDYEYASQVLKGTGFVTFVQTKLRK